MKKNMIIGAVLFLISLTSSVAQDGTAVNATVARSFEKNFPGASKPKWTSYEDNISLGRFKYMDRSWLAYFNAHGHLISSGRKVSLQELPAAVNEGILIAKKRNEKKCGPLSIGVIYEMVTDRQLAYFIPLANDKVHLLFSVDKDGTADLKRKTKVTTASSTPSVIARTNE
jgi:hypothetical protein